MKRKDDRWRTQDLNGVWRGVSDEEPEARQNNFSGPHGRQTTSSNDKRRERERERESWKLNVEDLIQSFAVRRESDMDSASAEVVIYVCGQAFVANRQTTSLKLPYLVGYVYLHKSWNTSEMHKLLFK